MSRDQFDPKSPNYSLYQMQLYNQTQLSWGKLRRKPATKWFDEYFAPLHNCEHRFARQNARRSSTCFSTGFNLVM